MKIYSGTQEEFLSLLKEITDDDVGHSRRALVGDRLSVIGDQRYGVSIDRNGLPEIDWCLVDLPALRERSTMEAIEIEEPNLGLFPFTIPFWIAKYPITSTQMLAFYEAEDGYRQDGWWEGMAVPTKMWDQDARIANYPAENVSWYTAVAFCRWLSQQLGFEVRLPTEAEWWFAATGGDRTRTYPWGSNWNSAYANTKEGGLGQTTAVGMFPGGAAPCGALDMIGNVWEWCVNEADTPHITDLHSGWWKASRGGSFMDSNHIGVLSRSTISPINSFAFRGFRVVRVGPL